MNDLMSKMGLADGASDEDKKAAMSKFAADCATKMADADDDALKSMSDDLEALAASLGEGDPDAAKMRAYAVRMRKMGAASVEPPAAMAAPAADPAMMSRLTATEAANKAMAAQLSELQTAERTRADETKRANEQRFSALADGAVAGGYPKESRDALISMARNDYAAAERVAAPFIKSAGVLFNRIAPQQGAGTASPSNDVRVRHSSVAGRVVSFGLNLSAAAKKIARERAIPFSQALDAARVEHPELVEQMYASESA